MLNRRNFTAWLGAVPAAASTATLLAAAQRAQAQTPSPSSRPAIDKLLRITVGFPPGGATDVIARLLADQLRGGYAPNAIVDNRAGAGGRIGAQIVKAGEADGSLILLTPASILTIYPHVYKKLGYDSLTDFAPVTSIASVGFALSVSSAVPASVKTVADFMAWAKANPQSANFGSPAAGATPHFVGVMLSQAAGVPLNHVPFKGDAPLVNDLLGGQIQAGVSALPAVLPHARAGKLRILAVSGAKRSRYLPEVPTLIESGFKDVDAEEYFAVFAPAKIPPATLARLYDAIHTALQAKPMLDGLESFSFEVGGETPAQFTRIVEREFHRWGPIVKASGFSSDE